MLKLNFKYKSNILSALVLSGRIKGNIDFAGVHILNARVARRLVFFVLIWVCPMTAQSAMLLTSERKATILAYADSDSTALNYMQKRVDSYLSREPYNAGEYAAASALLFNLGSGQRYAENAIRLLNLRFNTNQPHGWEHFKSRNLFRVTSKWAFLTFDWIKHELEPSNRRQLEDNFAQWGQYWLEYCLSDEGDLKLRVGDTDEVTSLASNLGLLATALADSTQYRSLSAQLLALSDRLLNDVVVDYYMNDIMRGGVWAEGSDYSPATQIHFLLSFLINKEARGISYPSRYPEQALQALRHLTLSNYSTTYKFGSEEDGNDYDPLGSDSRYKFALVLAGVLTADIDRDMLVTWWDKLIEAEGHPSGSTHLGIWRVLFGHHLTESTHSSKQRLTKHASPQSTLFVSPGVGVTSYRTSWDADASNLFFINRKARVDHEHNDALSFDFAYQGTWVSKEMTGYSGVASTSLAHNTLLIENATADGSSNPTLRPAGEPSSLYLHKSEGFLAIGADASKTYNMSGYFGTDYAEQVTRQLVMLGKETLIIFDRVVTDPNQTKDLRQYKPNLKLADRSKHRRWVKHIQHIQSKPKFVSKERNQFLYELDNQVNVAQFTVLQPANAVARLVDEQQLWVDAPEYEAPDSQRKWHIETTAQSVSDTNEFVTILNVGTCSQKTASVTPPNTCSADSTIQYERTVRALDAKSAQSLTEQNIVGVIAESKRQRHVILFNKKPLTKLNSNISFPLKSSYLNTTIYLVGVSEKENYQLSKTLKPGNIDVTLTPQNTSSDSGVKPEGHVIVLDLDE